MNAPRTERIRLHKDAALFRESLRFTAAETGFIPRLIEKDYFCTLVLQHLCERDPTLIFKGGTCLAKVHAGFYRLSEDLDFSISTPFDATRPTRRRGATAFKKAVESIPTEMPGLVIIDPVTGANNSKQYLATVGYSSLLGPNQETIKLEVGLREPVMTPIFTGDAQTLLLDPVRGQPSTPLIRLPCYSRAEAMAEKLRAALTRPDVAIRDFYDIDHAVRHLGVDVQDQSLLELVGKKLAVPGNGPVDVSEARLVALRPQLDAQLRPVLRPRDFDQFDLDRAFKAVSDVARVLPEGQKS